MGSYCDFCFVSSMMYKKELRVQKQIKKPLSNYTKDQSVRIQEMGRHGGGSDTKIWISY